MAWEPDYITDDYFKEYVGIELADTSDDDFIAVDISAASRTVDRCCSNRYNGLGAFRQFGKLAAPAAFYYTPRWDVQQMRWVIEIDDLMDVTGLTIAVDTTNQDTWNQPITSYALRPRDALSKGRPYTQIAISSGSSVQPTYFPDSAKVTGLWGWNAFPETVVRATAIQAHRYNKRRVSPFGIKGSPQRQTQQIISEEIDADVATLLTQAGLVKLGWTPS